MHMFDTTPNYRLFAEGREIQMVGYEDDYICNCIWRSNHFYEEGTLLHLLERHPVQRTIIDVGAHCGNYSVFFAEFLQYEAIHAFEPYKPSRDRLTLNLSDRYPNTTVHPWALADRKAVGTMIPHECVTDHGSRHFVEGGLDDATMGTLDEFKFTDVTLIKIDAEGFDIEVLKGGMETIKRDLPTLIVELNDDKSYLGAKELVEDFYAPTARWYYGGITYKLIPHDGSLVHLWDVAKAVPLHEPLEGQ